MYLKSSKFPSLTNESPHEHDLKHRQSLQRESSDYLKSIKAGLDLGILRQIPITKEVINDQRLQKDLFQGQNGQSYFSGSSGIQNQSDRDSMTNSLLNIYHNINKRTFQQLDLINQFVNAASYTMRGVRAPPQEQGYENYQTLQNQVKGKISGFYTQRPSLYGESNISKVQGIEMPLKEVKYKDTYFQGTAEHLLASNPRMIINKDYEKPRYGDAQASFRHPTYLPNHPNKKCDISLEHQEIVKAPLSTRRIQLLKQDNLEPREEFLKSVSYEAEKGFQTMRKSDSYLTLTPQVSVVGETTTVLMSLTLQHDFPVDGKLKIIMPKWNPFASSQSLMLSYITVSTSPGYVNCNPVLNFQSQKLQCLFTQGTSTDTLEIQMASDATSGIEAGKMLQLSILNFKTPPSMQQINSFQVQTTNSKGSLIDQSFANSIIYQATTQATIPSTFISITALDPKINRQTTIQIQIKNLNPIQADSSLIIIIPIEFDISGLNTLTGSGGRIKNSPTYVFTPASRQIEIKKFNQAYLEPLVNIYVNIATIRTPLSTLPTSSFSVTFIDPNGQNIESVSSGVVFNAQAGGLNTGATVTLSNKLINSMNVQYKFSFTPLNSINSGAIIRITFPDQILATNRVNSKLTSQSSQLSSNAILSVTSNKFAVITNAFSATYNPSTQGALSITINQITNPPTVTTTDTFKIEIYYTEIPYNFLTSFPTTSSTYILTVSAQPNTNLGLETILQSQDTGFNNQLQFKINTNGFQIAKGSYLRIVIPPQFEIYDYEIAGGTCLKISGFSDEVQCSFSKFTSDGHVLEVRNGFNIAKIQLYSGTGEEVSFNISQIRNPKTSRETDTFKLSIYDGNNNLQYVYSDTQTFRMHFIFQQRNNLY